LSFSAFVGNLWADRAAEVSWPGGLIR